MANFEINLSLRHFSAFMAVLEQSTIAAASEQLRRSPSTISRSLHIVEQAFTKPLLSRSRWGISATPSGNLVAERCRIIQDELSTWRTFLMRSRCTGLHNNAAVFRMHVDVSRLRALISVHEFGSVQRACQELSLAQPSVSSAIRQLETDLGLELFSRTPTGMIANPAGVSGALCAKRVLSELRKMQDDVASADGVVSGPVCVGALAYSHKALLPEAIRRVLAEYPEILVKTVEGPIRTLLTGMHHGDIDVIIGAHPNPDLLESVFLQPIAEDPTALFVAPNHPLAQCTRLTAEDILHYPFILPPAGSVTRRLLEEVFIDNTGQNLRRTVETASYLVIRNLLLNTDRVAFRSLSQFDDDWLDGKIVPLDLDFELPTRSICLMQRRGVRTTSAVDSFLSVVREVADEINRR